MLPSTGDQSATTFCYRASISESFAPLHCALHKAAAMPGSNLCKRCVDSKWDRTIPPLLYTHTSIDEFMHSYVDIHTHVHT